MNFIKSFVNSRSEIKRMRSTIARLSLENKRLRAQMAGHKRPTVADRTLKKEQLSPEKVLSEYLFGNEAGGQE